MHPPNKQSQIGKRCHVIGLDSKQTQEDHRLGVNYTTYFNFWSTQGIKEHGQRTYNTYQAAYNAGQHWNETGEIKNKT